MTIKAKIAPHIVEIISTLQHAGFEAFIVGGAVRDFILNRPPKDYDISCSATPEQIKRLFRQRRVIIIGRRFRLVHLYHHREIIEISTFRRQPSTRPNARPDRAPVPENMIFHDNEFGTAEEDAWRRDFTVNAIFYDPVRDSYTDYTGHGIEDLHNGVVRSIGDPELRFEEDPVRMLRALKLAGQYGFSIEQGTKDALTESMDLITHASNSRMTLELEKILKSPYSDKIFSTFREYGFLSRFLPYLDAKWESPQGAYMLKLLEMRNARILSGAYRDSISLAMSLMALPFAEELFGSHEPGALWTYFPGIESELKSLLCSLMHPRLPTRRALAAALRTLLLQPRVKACTKAGKLIGHPGYPHARELAFIQNEILWGIKGFTDVWPEPDHSRYQRRDGGRRRPYGRRDPKRDTRERHHGGDVEELRIAESDPELGLDAAY